MAKFDTKADLAVTEEIYRFILEHRTERGISPTYREIADAMFISTGTVQRHLLRLEYWGRIGRLPGRARGITVLDDAQR